MEDAAWTIGQLAKRLDLNPRTIRYYERIGVLPEPERSASGYRLYSEADESRLRFIKSAQRTGLTLGEIKEVLALRDRGRPPCRYVAGVIDQRLGEISQRVVELRALKRELTELRDRMHREGIAERDGQFCHYIETGAGAGSAGSRSRH